jgi:hypothetical protein
MSFYRKLFFLIFIVGIAVRFFVALTLPDAALSDTTYHLAIAEHITKTGFFPFEGITSLKLTTVPPGIFHIFIASASLLLGWQVNFANAVSFKILTSALQLLVAFILLRKLFPKNWVYGIAFFTMLPLLIKYSGVNYVETIASVLVLFSFYLFIEFHRTGQGKFLTLSVFSLAAMAMSKLNATILLPAFLLSFILECWKKGLGPKRSVLFLIAVSLLSSTWFVADFLRSGQFFSSNASSIELLVNHSGRDLASVSISKFITFWVDFNASFWAFPPEAAFRSPLLLNVFPFLGALSYDTYFWVFSLFALPLSLFLVFSLALLVMRRRPYSILLALIFCLALVVVLARATNFVFARMFLPAMPLLSLVFAHGFESFSRKWKRALVALTVIIAIYSFLNMFLFAVHYRSSFNESVRLYDAIAKLPENSKIIIAGNHVRTVRWVSGKSALGPEEAFGIPKVEEPTQRVKLLSKQEIYDTLLDLNITHLALTCLDDPWDRETINEMQLAGMIDEVFSEECALLYQVNRGG